MVNNQQLRYIERLLLRNGIIYNKGKRSFLFVTKKQLFLEINQSGENLLRKLITNTMSNSDLEANEKRFLRRIMKYLT
jgi:hypothetical protein